MFKKILGIIDKTGSPERPEKSQVERDLACIATRLPEARWIALVTCDGLLYSLFPSHSTIEGDRVSAMSAAMLSLGERIAGELKDGKLQYTLIAGAEGMTLVLALSRDYALSMGLNRDISVDTIFGRLRETLHPLLRTLQLENLLSWL
jgi:uncharacterized protein